MRCCTVCRCCSTCNPVAVYPPCTSAMLRTLQHRQPGMCVLRLGSAPYGCVSASSVSSRMRCAHPGQQASLSTRDFSKSDTRQSACSPTLTGGRHLASFAEDSGSDASAAHSGIRYLERWAGIHGGRTKSGRSSQKSASDPVVVLKGEKVKLGARYQTRIMHSTKELKALKELIRYVCR